MKKIILVVLSVLFITKNINAQNIDSVRVAKDSVPKTASLKKDTTQSLVVKKKWTPIPKKAFLYSIIPGCGQIYNRKLWYIKLPIVYGVMGFGVERIIYNGKYYRFFRDLNKVRKQGTPADIAAFDYSLFPRAKEADDNYILRGRDSFDKNYQQSYALTAIIYLLSGVEAFTTAHLLNFDVSDDLSLRLKPSFEGGTPYGQTVGLGISLSFR
jgi:Family of unknown function (DUF5683)